MLADSNGSTTEPRFSIVVNNYNYARYLAEALDSVISQMHSEDELIVVDDGSTDDSPTLLTEYAQTHGITVITQENQGQMHAVRTGISSAQGDIVVLLDSDDYFLEGYLQRLRAIYSEHPDVSFVFCNAKIGGVSESGRRQMSAMLDRMELRPGKTGTTRWSALLFQEFVGMPTSGNSMHKSLANKVINLPQQIEGSIPLSSSIARFLGISDQGRLFGLSADGVIVRYTSILNAQKYYDERPGFMYRIHGDNKYASTSAFGRWYLRHLRRTAFRNLPEEHFFNRSRPSATELRSEISGRSFGKKRRRRAVIRSKYCLAIVTSHGTLSEKWRAWQAALGIAASSSP